MVERQFGNILKVVGSNPSPLTKGMLNGEVIRSREQCESKG